MKNLLVATILLCCFALSFSQKISDLKGVWVGTWNNTRVNMTVDEVGNGDFYDHQFRVGDLSISVNGGLFSGLIVPTYNWNNGFVVKLTARDTIEGTYIRFGALRFPYTPIIMKKIK